MTVHARRYGKWQFVAAKQPTGRAPFIQHRAKNRRVSVTSPSQKDPRPYVKWPQRPARGAGGSRGSLGPPALGDAAPAQAGTKGSAVGTCPRPPRTVILSYPNVIASPGSINQTFSNSHFKRLGATRPLHSIGGRSPWLEEAPGGLGRLAPAPAPPSLEARSGVRP